MKKIIGYSLIICLLTGSSPKKEVSKEENTSLPGQVAEDETKKGTRKVPLLIKSEDDEKKIAEAKGTTTGLDSYGNYASSRRRTSSGAKQSSPQFRPLAPLIPVESSSAASTCLSPSAALRIKIMEAGLFDLACQDKTTQK